MIYASTFPTHTCNLKEHAGLFHSERWTEAGVSRQLDQDEKLLFNIQQADMNLLSCPLSVVEEKGP